MGPLEVLVGANGAGKSSFFEFLKFLRDGMTQSIPPEIIAGSPVRNVFHLPDSESFGWSLVMDLPSGVITHQGRVLGPVGQPKVVEESVSRRDNSGIADLRKSHNDHRRLLVGVQNPWRAADFVSAWRFHNSFGIANDKIRRPALIQQSPALDEDCGNLSAVLQDLTTEYPEAFEELQQHLRAVVPGFKGLKVRAFGAPGEVIAFWQEEGAGTGLVLTDLSDGILRLICWITLCVHPNPPPLICIDEPDQGVHPRTLPVLAALFQKASQRTQIVLATHSSYFLSQFDISQIAVIRKENGEAKFVKPKDSAVLMSMLEDFGPEEIEVLHRSDELERLP